MHQYLCNDVLQSLTRSPVMQRPMLLEPRTIDGRTVFIAKDDRSLTKTGPDSVMSTFHKELLNRLGFFEDGELLERDVKQWYEYDPEAGVLEITERIELPDEADPDPLDVLEESRDPPVPTAD